MGGRQVRTGRDAGEGEVLFDVPYDPSCPFRVVLDNIEIEVLGTRFNVYRKSNGEIIVTVLEGKVAVKERGKAGSAVPWRREVAANQRVVLSPRRGHQRGAADPRRQRSEMARRRARDPGPAGG